MLSMLCVVLFVTVVLLSELVWSGFSIAWIKKFYLDCDLIMTKQVMLGKKQNIISFVLLHSSRQGK